MFETDDQKKQALESYLMGLKQQRDAARATQAKSQVTGQDYAAAADASSIRGLGLALQKSANAFGTIGGKQASTEPLDEMNKTLDGADSMRLAGREKEYDRAVASEDRATKGMFDAEMNPLKLQGQRNEIRGQDQAFGFAEKSNPLKLAGMDLENKGRGLSNDGQALSNDLASRTMDSKVTQAGAQARGAVADANVAEGTLGSRISKSKSDASSAASNAQSAAAEAANTAARRSPTSPQSAAMRDLFRGEGINVPDNATAEALEKTYPMILRKLEAKQAAQEKSAANDLETAIPGYDKTGLASVRSVDASKLRDAAATRQTINEQLTELREIQSKYGDWETGPRGERMKLLSSSIQLKLKELENLGVLNGPDLAILQKQIPDVGSTLVSRNANTAATLGEAQKQIDAMVGNRLEMSGYKKQGGGAQFPRTVRNPKTGESAQVSTEAELAEARAEGFAE